MIDWSVTIAGIALIVAIISPVATTILNNRFMLKIKKWEISSQRKLEIIEGYLNSASDSAYSDGVLDDFAKYRATIFLYAPNNLHNKIRELNQAVEGTRFSSETAELLYEVAIALRKEAQIG